jgi:RNA polymerase sigma-70 factor (ECF subfamily)
VRAGDAAALEAIFYTHGARLLRFATQQLRAIDAAEDVVQDVFLGIWRIRARWTVRSSLASYLFQAVRRRIINRAQQRPAEDPRVATPLLVDELPGQAAAAPDRIVEDAELRRAIRRAVALLSPRTREVFQLSRDHGLSYREIAETLGVSVKTVEMHVGRALAALRIALAGWM